MKDLLFTTDLATLFGHDSHYGVADNLPGVLRKLAVSTSQSDSSDKMLHKLAVHIMDKRGESEPFLSETFIYPEEIVKLLKEHRLPIPEALKPQGESDNKAALDPSNFEQIFDTVCRNCGTVTDPLADSYRTPVGRLIFKTFLETRVNLGINTTAKYVLEHLRDFDTEKIITNIEEDYVTWTTEDSKEKLTSLYTIDKFVMNFNRELESLL